ncbi:hNH endonuclease [Escherichia coli]|uniref:hNH endonuclease n=1 Tax=Escherichia coli TaxID=562 RepID=UPI001CA3A93F|nr:hNH endonuclease [Escherichia coli]MBY8618031.1 hNH endonuclease [Escherichia coli]MDM1151937.1 hNH endonuclease [Escherichia coli]
MKQMSLIEMDGFLKGKCIPRDLKVNETNAEYLVRKFAEAEAKCAALAAELSAIEEIHNDAVFITDAHYDQCHPEVQKIIGALAVLQIPAYQDFLAEVRAQGLNAFIQHRSAELDAHIKNGGEQFDEKSVRIRDIIVSAACSGSRFARRQPNEKHRQTGAA